MSLEPLECLLRFAVHVLDFKIKVGIQQVDWSVLDHLLDPVQIRLLAKLRNLVGCEWPIIRRVLTRAWEISTDWVAEEVERADHLTVAHDG